MHFLISAGPTVEDIDPVRFISNRASGKLGVELARAALKAGNTVTLVHGVLSETVQKSVAKLKVQTESVRSAEQMHKAMLKHLPKADVILMNASVADYSIATVSEEKLKKSNQKLVLTLKPTPDILKDLGKKRKKNQILVGFALETGSGKSEKQRAETRLKEAHRKLKDKKADVIVLDTPEAMGGEDGTFTLIDVEQAHELGKLTKRRFAEILVMQLTPFGGGSCCDHDHGPDGHDHG